MAPHADPAALVSTLAAASPEERSQVAWTALDAVNWPRHTMVPPLAEELTPGQRQIAEALAAVTGLWLSQYAIPQYVQLRRRWLGIDPPSLFERPVSVPAHGEPRTLPLWKALANLGGTIMPDAAQLLLPDPVERLQVFALCELWQPYGVGLPQGTIALAEEVGPKAAAWAAAFADELLAIPKGTEAQMGGTTWTFQPLPAGLYEFPSRAPGISTLFAALIPLVRAHGVLAPRYYPLLPAFRHPQLLEILGAITESDREEALLGLLRRAPDATAVDIAIAVLPTFPYANVVAYAQPLLASADVARTFGPQKLKRQREAWAALCGASTPRRGHS